MYISRLIQHISPKLLKRYGIATSANHQQPQVTLCLLEIFLHLHQHLHQLIMTLSDLNYVSGYM